ncbi:unnamed protein product [Candidula unifasciata]|uniref:ABC-type glutathione-S-conjugate transporter n=1 Tax=Candidula unifasciata TaxID=100452 RepID=A0A8S3Z0U0_9EUPU|nr:unnamed protein product [Candidula unifasciata]
MSQPSGQFGTFCDTPLWDLDLTWHGSWPQFTECFQSTILVWVPCGWLWVSAPFYTWYLAHLPRPTHRRRPCSWLLTLKLICLSLTIVLSSVSCFNVISNKVPDIDDMVTAEVFAPLLLTVTLCLATAFTVAERRKRLVTSGVQFVFWLLLSVCSLIVLYTDIQLKVYDSDVFSFSIFSIQYSLYLVELLLHCFPEKPMETSTTDKQQSPEIAASFPSRLTFWWLNPIMSQGYREPLTEEDMPDLHPRDKCQTVVPKFMYYWMKALAFWKTRQTLVHTVSFAGPVPVVSSVNTSPADNEQASLLRNGIIHNGNGYEKRTAKETASGPSLSWILFQTFWREFLLSQIWKVFSDILAMCSPLILGELVDYVMDPDSENWNGYVLAVGLFISTILQSLLYHQVFHLSTTLGLRLRASIISAVFRKSLTMDNLARKESTVGEVVNLMSVDAERIESCISYMWAVWSSPLQIILSLYLLYQYIGVSMFAGAAFLVLLIPTNGYITAKLGNYQTKLMEHKDDRMKVMNEVLSGIKIIKLFAWEKSFETRILDIREKELQTLRISAIINSVLTFSWTAAPFVVSLLTFLCYVFIADNHYLDPKTAFVAISLFDILRYAINFAPMIVTDLLKAFISARRIGRFLCHDDLDKYSVSHVAGTENIIDIRNASFRWSSETSQTLTNINMVIGEDSLVAVVGAVGSGKSSLISAILGDMEKLSGTVNVRGSIAYVPQQAWIQNNSVRNNILFGKLMDKELYNRCIDACALRPDLDMLSAGDRTEIGERGINLSGGQKQRVSLARALYAQADVYLLDDPLSAVDSHVGQHIFDYVIGHSGMLEGKVRVLVTHGIQYLAHTDQIVVMTEGRISESGHYDELLSHNGVFARLIRAFLFEGDDGEDTDNEELQELKQEVLRRLSETEEEGDGDLQIVLPSVHRQVPNICSPHTHDYVEIPKVETVGKMMLRQVSQQSALIEEEIVELGNVKFSIYRQYMQAVGYFYVFLIFFLYALYTAANMGALIFLSAWTDDPDLGNFTKWPSNSSSRRNTNDYYVGMYGFFGLLQTIFIIGFSLLESLRTIHASRLLHGLMLSRVLHAPMSFFDTTPVGRIINRFSKDIDDVDNEIPMTFLMWLDCMFAVASTIIIISYSTPLFLAFLLPVAGVYYFIQKYYIATSRQLKRLGSKTRSPIFSHFSETLAGASVVRAFNAENWFVAESDAKVDTNQIFMFINYSANRWLGFRLESVGNMIILLAATIAVAMRDSISGGIMGLSVTFALQITENLNWLVMLTSDMETQIVSVERIMEYTTIDMEASWENTLYQSPIDWPSQGHVQVEALSLRYRDGLDLVLKAVSFEVQPGEKVGIVGRTGAGKSSLTLALFRLVEPVGGRILIDNIDISMLGLHDLRSKVTILPQDPIIFAGTLKENLDPFGEHTEDALWRALEHAHLRKFVEGLSDRLDHECGEGGENLSVGQRQLLCLGRALLRKTQILILDEATAAVDMETDELIQETIRQEFKNCTILTIAHRLNTVMDYNRILVLEKGEVREFDSPQTLLKKPNGVFYGLAKAAGLV